MSNTCPQCHAPLPADAPAGLCPRCLIRSAAGLGEAPSGDVDFPDIGDMADVARRLPQFEILELLGKGGMGVVYKARQTQLDRLVALKILPPVDALSPDFVERFRREARALAKLSHPNIVAVHEFGEQNGLHFFVMEYVEGANLRQLFEARKLTSAEALAIVPKICDALQYAHEEGLVHRDIKPENLLIDKKGRVKIADFGLAKLLRREPLDMTLTLSGMTLGTLRYMAPEQMDKPETVDHRADLYSLGVVIYEMLTGETPVGRFELPSQKAGVDVRLDKIVLHALEREPSRRYQHASEVRDDVEKVTSKPHLAPPSASTPREDWTDRDARQFAMLTWVGLYAMSMLGICIALYGVIETVRTYLVASAAGGTPAAPWVRALVFSVMLANVAFGMALMIIGRNRQRERSVRMGAINLVCAGALLTIACGNWFDVPSWLGSLYMTAAFIGWMIFRKPDIKTAFARIPPPGSSPASQQAAADPVTPAATKRSPRHLLSAFLVLLCLFGFFFGFSFQAKHSGSAAGMTKIITVGALDPLFTSESEPSGFQTSLNFFSWSFFAVVVAGIALGALWRIGREDQGKVPRDSAWWRDWWKQVGVWGGLLLIACTVRTVMHPEKVLQLPGERTVSARYVGKQAPASVPPLGTITNGIGADFTVPAGQVAILEIVTRKDNTTVPVPPHCAYVLAGEGAIAGTFRWSREPEQKDGPFRRWRIELVSGAGNGSTIGIALPEALDEAVGAMGLTLGVLEPNEETVHGSGPVALRITTVAHNLKAGGSGVARTDWKKAQTKPKP